MPPKRTQIKEPPGLPQLRIERTASPQQIEQSENEVENQETESEPEETENAEEEKSPTTKLANFDADEDNFFFRFRENKYFFGYFMTNPVKNVSFFCPKKNI
jgi:hypothetical protein